MADPWFESAGTDHCGRADSASKIGAGGFALPGLNNFSCAAPKLSSFLYSSWFSLEGLFS